MTLTKLAQMTGFSLATVSKAFSGSSEIPEGTKTVIFNAARELGIYDKYIKTKHAQRVIAIIVPELIGDYYPFTLNLLCEDIKQRGAIPMVSVSDFSLQTEERLLSHYLSNKNADGIIVIGGKSKRRQYYDIPVVYLGGIANLYADRVSIDAYSGTFEALRIFKLFGHTKIAFIGEERTKEKEENFKTAMKDLGLTVDPGLIFTSKERFERAGTDGVNSLFKQGKNFTAVLAAYDYIALGVLTAVEERGLKIPEDISLIGYNNSPITNLKKISLSSIDEGSEEACKIAVKILFEKIEGQSRLIFQDISLKSSLNLRGSVAGVGGGVPLKEKSGKITKN